MSNYEKYNCILKMFDPQIVQNHQQANDITRLLFIALASLNAGGFALASSPVFVLGLFFVISSALSAMINHRATAYELQSQRDQMLIHLADYEIKTSGRIIWLTYIGAWITGVASGVCFFAGAMFLGRI